MEYSTEYYTEYSIEYENQKNRIFQKNSKTAKILFFWNMEYSRNIPEIWQNNKNVGKIGIWNIRWNIPGILKKTATTKILKILEYGIFQEYQKKKLKKNNYA